MALSAPARALSRLGARAQNNVNRTNRTPVKDIGSRSTYIGGVVGRWQWAGVIAKNVYKGKCSVRIFPHRSELHSRIDWLDRSAVAVAASIHDRRLDGRTR